MKTGSEKVFVLLMILSEDGKFLSIDQLEEKFNISKNIMKFNSIISAVKHAGKQNVYNSYKLLTPFIPSFVKTILKSKRGTKDIRGGSRGGTPGAPPSPPKIGKNMIFWRKIMIFHMKYPKKI